MIRPIEVHYAGIHVATVDAFGRGGTEEVLDYAFRWTQNLEGSWSTKDGNPDNNTDVTVIAPLPVHDGRTMGHRSSMVGDIFILDGVRYRVDSFGFEPEGTPQ